MVNGILDYDIIFYLLNLYYLKYNCLYNVSVNDSKFDICCLYFLYFILIDFDVYLVFFLN